MALEGLPRHASTHAAGIVISKLPLDDYVPLYSSDKGVATQFNMTTIEELGLLKMDARNDSLTKTSGNRNKLAG
jgi:DNA polymerase-3 subunit alpha